MKKISIEIAKIISGTLLLATGFGLTVNFLNGLMLIGIVIGVGGITLLVYTAVVAR